jgi:proline iminopeptidase
VDTSQLTDDERETLTLAPTEALELSHGRSTAMLAHVNGTELYYETVGEGRPLLLMHGGLGFDHTYFRPSHDQLAERGFTVIYYDHRGNGRSQRPADWSGVSHATWAADADALRQHLGYDTITLLGQSYGGVLALEYALRYQQHLDGLILSCTLAALDYPEVIEVNARERGTPEEVAEFLGALANPSDSDDELRALFTKYFKWYFHRWDPEAGAAGLAKTHFSGPAFQHAFTQCMPHYNVVDRLQNITVPTLVLAGRHDWIAPPAQAERIAAHIDGAGLFIFGNSGHMPHDEEPALYQVVVGGWLATV